MTLIKQLGMLLVAGLASLGLIAPANAEFPEKPIEFIIPFGAGGGADIEGRLLAQEMGKVLGVSVVPVNKPGGGGAVTYTYVKNAAPDGYTIAWNSTSILTTTNLGNVPFGHDAMDHVGRVEWQPQVFAVKADAEWKTYKDFVEACKANPNMFKIANAGTGSSTHIGAIELMTASGCEAVHVPVGIQRRNATVLSGETHAMVAPLTGAVKLTKGGKMRILALISDKRNEIFPDVPTAKEQGYDATLTLFRGLSVPKGTPPEVLSKLTDAMTKAARSEAFMKLAADNGFTVDPLPPSEFDKILEEQNAKVARIIEQAGLKEEKKN